jgi:uncharacterized protein
MSNVPSDTTTDAGGPTDGAAAGRRGRGGEAGSLGLDPRPRRITRPPGTSRPGLPPPPGESTGPGHDTGANGRGDDLPAGSTEAPEATTAPGAVEAAAEPDGRRRRVTWRQALWAGLTCFVVWLLLDAPTLQRSAQAAPFGTRRTVALDVLGPIAATSRALQLDHVLGAYDRVFGRTGGSVVAVSGPTPAAGHGAPPPIHRLRPGAVSPGIGGPAPPAPLPTPTAAAPLQVLVIGDSIGIDLGESLVDELAQTGVVHAELDGKVDTGLARPDYFNWPAELAHDLAVLRPQVVVVLVGANDPQNFVADGQAVSYGTPAWTAAYGQRVGDFMHQITATGARGLWIGLPPMADPNLNAEMRSLNGIFEAQAAQHPGIDFFPSWPVLSTPQGAFATYLPDSSGAEVDVRTPDGTHLAPGGAERLATAVITDMNARWGLHLHP